ncbi:hypothetical protein E2562_037970 [Oryza meyeriana var. granulata]|uniref:Uncharacterized protein n=1 Tax=Oryza meyeriana var. granulata TaxID=110450 RepID=A0A6G1CNB3_9ORYZ|nr:hypothetical protein E2562_037970 [Oryza meyeriana var. granulata]
MDNRGDAGTIRDGGGLGSRGGFEEMELSLEIEDSRSHHSFIVNLGRTVARKSMAEGLREERRRQRPSWGRGVGWEQKGGWPLGPKRSQAWRWPLGPEWSPTQRWAIEHSASTLPDLVVTFYTLIPM